MVDIISYSVLGCIIIYCIYNSMRVTVREAKKVENMKNIAKRVSENAKTVEKVTNLQIEILRQVTTSIEKAINELDRKYKTE